MKLIQTRHVNIINGKCNETAEEYRSAAYPLLMVLVSRYDDGRRYISISNGGFTINRDIRRGVFIALKVRDVVKIDANETARRFLGRNAVAEHYEEVREGIRHEDLR